MVVVCLIRGDRRSGDNLPVLVQFFDDFYRVSLNHVSSLADQMILVKIPIAGFILRASVNVNDAAFFDWILVVLP